MIQRHYGQFAQLSTRQEVGLVIFYRRGERRNLSPETFIMVKPMTFTSRFLFFSILSIAFMIEKTYQLGVYYREEWHSTVVEYSKKGIALAITVFVLFLEGVRYVYNNRVEYITKLNQYREYLSQQFVYTSPILT